MGIWKRAITACEDNAKQHYDVAVRLINARVWAEFNGDVEKAEKLSNVSRHHLRQHIHATELPAILRQVLIELKRK